MKVVFMGTPDFAVASLKALLDSDNEVTGVFTKRDMPKNRGMKMTMPPVKELALAEGIPVFQPDSLKQADILDILRELAPDIIIVAAYGLFLPKAVLELPPYGCINVHASLLPKYRGAAPINAAIVDGCAETGVTIMQMTRGIDTGDMLLSESVTISDTDTYGTLHDRLAVLGGKLLLDALEQIASGTVKAIQQDDSQSSYAHMISTADAEVTFAADAKSVSCHVRGYDPVPGAYGYLGEEKIKLFGASVYDGGNSRRVGEIVSCDKNGLVVQAEDGTVLIKEVQLSGKKRMPAADCFRGRPKLLEERFK